MEPSATAIQRPADSTGRAGRALTLPPDLLQKVRSRVKLAALLLALGFLVDPAIFLLFWLIARVTGEVPAEVETDLQGLTVNLLAILISLGVWAVARRPRSSQAILLSVGLVFEVVICLVISIDTHQYFAGLGQEPPHLTWVVPIIILFPLILPSPPGRMLLAAIGAAATSPISLLILSAAGTISTTAEQFVHASLNPALAVVLAYFAARVVYGLNLDVVRARRLGSYRLTTLLGRGGMGEVWKAEHHLLARPAAIKLIEPQALAASASEPQDAILHRFEREAQATASLRSPNTVHLYDFGRSDDGTLYYVMELLDGMDLETLIERYGPVPAERAVHLLLQVCHSLAEAHETGLVHRDIKPANVFVCRYGLECDFVKVLDFGLVKSRRVPGEEDLHRTAEDVAGGTPAYMAPEQALGSAEVDGRTDLYGVGCVAYWLLTGHRVFESTNAIEMITHHLRTPPTAPSASTELAVPPELDRIVLDCLAKSPADRPDSALGLAARLREVATAHPWTGERATEWWNRHRPVAVESEGA